MKEPIERDGRIIYRPDDGKKLKFKNNDILYSEIVLHKDEQITFEEVDE